MCETYFDHVAHQLSMNPDELRLSHLNKDGDQTHYNQKLFDCRLSQMWKQVTEARVNPERRCDAL